VTGKGGDDYIQTLSSTVNGTPYNLVLNGGPGDDQIGISTTNSDNITRIDGGPGFDELFINPYYAGSQTRLDLTDVGRRIKNIEMIDVGYNNSIKFSFLNVRELSGTSNTLLLRGSNSTAIAVDGNNWKLPPGQGSHDGVLYKVYEYLQSDIQVWIEDGGVSWSPAGQ
jgi:hypothetical protein